jgi:predicted unusual protein kinase regulating ubiquinone biosynthesis (AarF/ABC1/UbiB family)
MVTDLHPGNMLIDFPYHSKETTISKDSIVPPELMNLYYELRNHGTKNQLPPLTLTPKDPKTICLVDAGMVAQLSDIEASVFIGVLAAIGEGDGKLAAHFALQFSIDNNNHLDTNQRDAFTKDMVELFQERCRGYGTNVDLGSVLRGVLQLLGKHKVRFDSNFATLVVNVLCIQGLAYDVCPEYNVLDAAEPLLRTYQKLCFTRDGVPNNRNARTSKLVRSRLLLMYAKKRIADTLFFRNLTQQRKHKLQQMIVNSKQ